jgi:hypothetical protein
MLGDRRLTPSGEVARGCAGGSQSTTKLREVLISPNGDRRRHTKRPRSMRSSDLSGAHNSSEKAVSRMKLRVFQALAAMNGLPYKGETDWSLEEKFERMVDAGFDGIEIPWTPTQPLGPNAIEQANELGLDWSIACFPTSVDHFKEIAALFAGSRVRHINLQPNVRPLTVLEGIPYILGCLDVAREAGLTVYFETHRDRMTTDLRYTLQLIDAVPSMQLVADLSHVLVGQEFAWPVSEEDHALVRRLLARASGFHGRVASREQVQIPVTFAHHKQWLDLFLVWWEEGFELWRRRADPTAELVFVTELLPANWYAITGADGNELSDRWEEALLLKQLVREIWDRLELNAPGVPVGYAPRKDAANRLATAFEPETAETVEESTRT